MRTWTVCLLSSALLAPAAAAADPRCFGPSPAKGASAAILVEDVAQAHTTQLLPTDDEGRIVGTGKLTEQIDRLLENLAATLRGVDSGLDRVVKVNLYVTRADAVAAVDAALARRFKGPHRPAVSLVVTPLPHPDALVALDAVATSDAKDLKRTRGAAVLPAGARLYISGQAEKGKDLAEATSKTLASLDATLKSLGRTRGDVVQAKAFLTPMKGVEAARKEMAAFFGDSVPPLAFVGWKSTLPIEIELVVSGGKPRDGDVIEFLTPPGVTASTIYSRVARVNRGPTIYVGSLYGPTTGGPADEVAGAFASLKKVLDETGSDWKHLAKATYYVTTDVVSGKLNEMRPRYYDARRPPAASKAMVTGVGRPGTWTLDMIAVPAAKGEK